MLDLHPEVCPSKSIPDVSSCLRHLSHPHRGKMKLQDSVTFVCVSGHGLLPLRLALKMTLDTSLCVFVCVSVCIHVCLCLSLCCMCLFFSVSLCMCLYLCVCARVGVRVHVCVCTRYSFIMSGVFFSCFAFLILFLKMVFFTEPAAHRVS